MQTQEVKVDMESNDSFPAGDTPAWIPVTGIGAGATDDSSLRSIQPYNYDHFKADYYDLLHFGAPMVKETMPNFAVYDIEGHWTSLLSFDEKRLVIETGSLTCPMFMSNVAEMEKLNTEFTDTKFMVMYVREAHPGSKLPHHSTLEEKIERARELHRQTNMGRQVVVDDINGKVHKQLGGMPNSLIVLERSANVLYCGSWARPADVRLVLSSLRISRSQSPHCGVVLPQLPKLPTLLSVLSSAGFGAMWDFGINSGKLIRKRWLLKQHLLEKGCR